MADHTTSTIALWQGVQAILGSEEGVVLDGHSLDVSSLVAVARHAAHPSISDSPALADRLARSVAALGAYMASGNVVYGVNTGFGGSADSRTDDLLDLQISLLQHTQSGIVTTADKDPANNWASREPAHVMQPDWVRGAMAARVNQNLRGHSAVRLEVLQGLVAMVRADLVPLVPLRGTISASGDLMPMSYIAGALTGNPDVYVQVGTGRDTKVLSAPDALRESGLSPTGLGPKEGLGLINGTAPSVSLGSLVLYDAQQLAYLSQLLTAFASEGLGGNVEWASAFIHEVRPHPGQVEAARNIRGALAGSTLVVGLESRRRAGDGLWQDRYSTRTAPQWIGPYLEDLMLAQRQLEVELNSTSDNPLVDAGSDAREGSSGDVFSGGNFQAVAVTSAMDKTRLALQMIGRMLFSQVSEMIHPSTSNGLAANLNASDRDNFTMKGIDVNMAAYMSELAALAHPVSSHVMSAEMHNQGINSLALVSARRTLEAVDIVRHMCACHVYVSCQAVDLRYVQDQFLEGCGGILSASFVSAGLSRDEADKVVGAVMPTVESTWRHWNAGTWTDRVSPVVDAIMAKAAECLAEAKPDMTAGDMHKLRGQLEAALTDAATETFPAMDTAGVPDQLGAGTAPLYRWVREELKVPTHRGLEDDPLYNARHGKPVEDKKTIGSWVAVVYESLRAGMMDMVMREAAGLRAQSG